MLRYVRSSKVFWESLHPHCFVTCLRNNKCMEELCGDWLTHWQTDAYNKQIHTCLLLLSCAWICMNACLHGFNMTHGNIVEGRPTKVGELPAMFTTSKEIHFFLNLAKHWLQHGEPVRGTVYKKKRIKKKKHERGKKNLCKHGTINRSNSRFRTMHVMTYIFLWYNFHTSYSHQLQFVVFSF